MVRKAVIPQVKVTAPTRTTRSSPRKGVPVKTTTSTEHLSPDSASTTPIRRIRKVTTTTTTTIMAPNRRATTTTPKKQSKSGTSTPRAKPKLQTDTTKSLLAFDMASQTSPKPIKVQNGVIWIILGLAILVVVYAASKFNNGSELVSTGTTTSLIPMSTTTFTIEASKPMPTYHTAYNALLNKIATNQTLSQQITSFPFYINYTTPMDSSVALIASYQQFPTRQAYTGQPHQYPLVLTVNYLSTQSPLLKRHQTASKLFLLTHELLLFVETQVAVSDTLQQLAWYEFQVFGEEDGFVYGMASRRTEKLNWLF